MNDNPVIDQVRRSGVIAVLTLDDARLAVPLARALVAGGITAMELTLRTPAALEALRAIVAEVPELLAGAGTVLTPQQVGAVRAAGAAFAVAPGTNARVIEAAREEGLFFMPGVATPSDIELAVECDCRALKFFPAEPCGGLAYLKNMAAPYAHLGLRFVPLGGITTANVRGYLQDPLILAVGGSWLAPRERIAAEDWPAITQTAQEAVACVSQAGGRG
jgi:2-dehydro-3-deoxyphosphogluconate aldolase/(4S)-4-hydroxy-2-oxoglutarate aldolase